MGMRRELDELQRQLEVPMVLITHDPEDAKVFGGQLLHLRDGRIDDSECDSDIVQMAA
jgi:molybdate transport system ATP-binding protein